MFLGEEDLIALYGGAGHERMAPWKMTLSWRATTSKLVPALIRSLVPVWIPGRLNGRRKLLQRRR